MKEEKWVKKYIQDELRGYNKDLDFYIDGYYSKDGAPTNPCSEIELEKDRRRLLIRRAA